MSDSKPPESHGASVTKSKQRAQLVAAVLGVVGVLAGNADWVGLGAAADTKATEATYHVTAEAITKLADSTADELDYQDELIERLEKRLKANEDYCDRAFTSLRRGIDQAGASTPWQRRANPPEPVSMPDRPEPPKPASERPKVAKPPLPPFSELKK